MSNQEPNSSLEQENLVYPGPSTEDPCCSKSLISYDNPTHKAGDTDRFNDRELPSTSRSKPSLRVVEWETLERNWSGYTSANFYKRAPKRVPETPKAAHSSKKGKGIGKGKRNQERALIAQASAQRPAAAAEPTANIEDFSIDTVSIQDEPMDLSVNENFDTSQNDIKVIKKLHSVNTTIDNSVDFYCQFDFSGTDHFFIWFVGEERITCSNYQFRVACRGGLSILSIPKVESRMAGLIVCQLRTFLPNGRSRIRAHTSCYMVVAPNVVTAEYMPLHVEKVIPFEIMFSKYSKWSSNGIVWTSDVSLTSWWNLGSSITPGEVLFEMEYCRIEDDYYYYLNITKLTKNIRFLLISVQENECNKRFLLNRKIKIDWDYHGYIIYNKKDIWYRVERLNPEGNHNLLGISSKPSLVYNNAVINVPAKFRITAIKPSIELEDTQISLTQQPVDTRALTNDFIPRPLLEYSRNYENEEGVIGSGAFGTVCIAKNIRTKKKFAVKTIHIISYEHRDACYREFQLLRSLDHPKIVKLHDAYSDLDTSKLVMECLYGKDLYERFADYCFFHESDVIQYIRQICEGLLYLHDRGIMHLDLKPENIVCVHPNSKLIKLIDFGMSQHRSSPIEINLVQIGTRTYVSPEILRLDQLTVQCDMWSLGVIAYILLSTMPPFSAVDWNEEIAKIANADYNYDHPIFNEVSDVAKDFMDKLLEVDWDRRLTSREALQHPWLRDDISLTQLRRLKRFRTPKFLWRMAGVMVIIVIRLKKPSVLEQRG